jgi:hypothetical protein
MDNLKDKIERVFERKVSKGNWNWSKEWKVLLFKRGRKKT